jgi:hypothetical protein
VGKKTVTEAFSAEQFAWLKEAIANQRELWNTLLQMQQLTARYALENLPNPPRRKRLSQRKLGLNLLPLPGQPTPLAVDLSTPPSPEIREEPKKSYGLTGSPIPEFSLLLASSLKTINLGFSFE